MTQMRGQPIEREKAERRELKAAGWKPHGRGAKAVWQNPADGSWHAHYRAVAMLLKEGLSVEEEQLLHEQGFKRTAAEDRERWERQQEGVQQLYTRSQALVKARREVS